MHYQKSLGYMSVTVVVMELLDYGVPYLLFIDNVLYVIPIFGLHMTKYSQNQDIDL